jgi:hypothetical protein
VAPVTTGRIDLTHNRCQQRVTPQLLVVVEILVSQSQGEHPLAEKLFQTVLHISRIAVVGETSGELLQNGPPAIDLTQQEDASIRRQSPPIKRGHQCPAPDPLKLKLPRITVCRHRAVLLLRYKSCRHKTYTTGDGPMCFLS